MCSIRSGSPSTWSLAVLLALGVTHPVAAQQDSGSHSPSPGISWSGYGEASYVYSSRNVGGAVVGRLYDRIHDAFTLNALKLSLDRPAATDRLDAGVHADLVFGQNAEVLHSAGFTLGNQGDATQLYVTLNIPDGKNGWQFKAGKQVTLMGLEVIEDVANPTWSEGNQFIYVENFTAVGVSVEHQFSSHADMQLRLINGWDVVRDNNSRKSFMGRVGLYPDKQTSLALVGFYGPEEANSTAERYGIDALVNHKFGRATLWVQGDYGKEQANAALPDPTRAAKWWAAGVWLAYDFSPKVGFALRGDYMDDKEAARTAGAFGLAGAPDHKLWTATGTLNVHVVSNFFLRPEVRYDHSNLAPLAGQNSQVTVATSVAFLY